MGLDVSFEGVDETKLDGVARCEAGKFHFEITHFEEDDPKSPGNCYVDCEVLAGDPGSEVGKNHREYFSLKSTAMGRFAQFLLACKIVTKEQIAGWRSSGQMITLTAAHFVGRQFCGKIVNEEYEGNVRPRLNFNIWAIDSKSAKGIPMDQAKAKAFLAKVAPKSAAKPNGQAAQSQPAAQQPALAQVDPLRGSEDLFGV